MSTYDEEKENKKKRERERKVRRENVKVSKIIKNALMLLVGLPFGVHRKKFFGNMMDHGEEKVVPK